MDIERAVACVVGGGGLGDIAIASGHQRFAVVITIRMVQAARFTGNWLARKAPL
ncbi:hypothetical protein [Saccharopolyspora sp. NPDC050642]|uniref:hypothetical protein n=1 Tax=Saccharopolyspora sp. NPDC050642 TaxID=3157099 RepID=UPI0033E4D888